MFIVIIPQHFEGQGRPLMMAPRTQTNDAESKRKEMTCLPSNFCLTSLTYKTECTSQRELLHTLINNFALLISDNTRLFPKKPKITKNKKRKQQGGHRPDDLCKVRKVQKYSCTFPYFRGCDA